MADIRLNTPTEQLFWHLSVAIHHLGQALTLHEAHGILNAEESRALHQGGEAIGTAMERLADEDEDA